MNTYDFPEVGPRWFSNVFYATLSAFIRLIEVFYKAVDVVMWPLLKPFFIRP